jgi:predicted ATPase/DNA-binding SARP family transcriptional activator
MRFQNVAVATSGNERTRIQLCGRLSVEIDGVQLAGSLRGKQVPLLLAYLVLNRDRHVGREDLIGALWPDEAPRSQDAALRTLLSRLRSALGRAALVGRDELVLALPEPAWIDYEAAGIEIERARRALERGDARSAWALAQVPLNIASRGLLPGSQTSWLDAPRRELEDIRLEALEVIGRAGLSLGGTQLGSAQRAARTLIDAEPYRESGYMLLMEVLAAEGNVAEGLRVFERLRTLLRDELGTTPSRDAIELHTRLLRPARRADQASAATASHTGAPLASVELPAELLSPAHSRLVGRTNELDELGGLWARVQEGSAPGDASERAGRVVLLAGDAGIGKTRLVAEVARRAHDGGAFVLAGRSPRETLVPYQPFVEALRHYLMNAPLGELGTSAREYGAELARLVPELRRRAPDLPRPVASEPDTERYRLFEAVVGLVSEISASAPVLFVLDDLEWADRPSLLLLRHLARAADRGRLLILGAYRETDLERNAFGDALAELRRERLVRQIDIGGLAEPETAELVRLRAGGTPSRALCRAVHEETEGNPFFIEEVVRHLAEAGVDADHAGAAALARVGVPEGVKDVISRRLGRLDAQAIEWLRVAAVIGRDFDLALLERVVALDEEESLAALEEALAAGLVVESHAQRDGHYSFSHGLIRETLYEAMSAPRRARLHRRVGEALEQAGPDRNLAALALHFERAGGSQDAEKAIRYAVRAGEQATAMLAHEEAGGHYARALEVLERFHPEPSPATDVEGDLPAAKRRCELLLMLGEARVREGNRSAAWDSFRRAAALARTLGDEGSLARAAIGASQRYVQQSGVVNDELIAMLEEALAVTAGERTVIRVLLLARLCGALYYSPARARMRELSAEATALASELLDLEARAVAAGARRRAYWDPAHLDVRLQSSTELLALAREAGSLELSLQGHAWLVTDLLESGERDEVEAQIEAFADGARELRQPLYAWQAAVWSAMLALLDGELERAEQLAQEALALGAGAEPVTSFQNHAALMLAIRQEQDRAAELEEAAREFVASYPAAPAWRAGLASILLSTGQREAAAWELEWLAAHEFADVPRDGSWIVTLALLGELSARLGDAVRAERLYELLAPFEEINVVIGIGAVCHGSTARYLGLLAGCMGWAERARKHFERALAANAALRAPILLAHAQLDYAGQLGGMSNPRARKLIEAAARSAQELSAPALARRVGALRGGADG